MTGVPKKSLLRMLAEYCSDPKEAHALQFLCTKAGRDLYGKLIEASKATLLDMLNVY